MPGIDDLSMLTVQLGDKVERIASCQSEDDFIACLRSGFGCNAVPSGKTIFLNGKDSKGRAFRIKLSSALKVCLESDEPCTIEFVDRDDAEDCQGQQQKRSIQDQDAELLSVQDRRRALQVKRGRTQTKALDPDGNPLSTKGKNVHRQLTNLQTEEMHKLVHLTWEANPKSGCPLNLESQDPAVVKASILKMQSNPVLQGRPEAVLKRKASSYVSYLNRTYDEGSPYEEGLIWTDVKEVLSKEKDLDGSEEVGKLYADARKKREAKMRKARQARNGKVQTASKPESRRRGQGQADGETVRSPKRRRVMARRCSSQSDNDAEDREAGERDLERPPSSEEEWESDSETEDDLTDFCSEDSSEEGSLEDEKSVWKEFCELVHGERREEEETGRHGSPPKSKGPAKKGTEVKKGGAEVLNEVNPDAPKPLLSVSLWNWYPEVWKPAQDSTPKTDDFEVRVCGRFAPLDSDDENEGKLWRSNAIARRDSARKLIAGSEKSPGPVKLLGRLDIESMLKEGFSESAVEAFNGGFPEDWREVLGEEFSRFEIESARETAGRGKRKKKPSKRVTEAAAAAQVVLNAKKRPAKTKSAVEEAKDRKRNATRKMDEDAAAALLALEADDSDSEQDG